MLKKQIPLISKNVNITILKIAIVVLFCTLSSCASKKESLTKISTKKDVILTCPEDGSCTAKLIKNKSLIIKTDDLGKIFYQLQDSENTSVVFYTYNRNVEKDIQDGTYREEIILEISNSANQINLEDKDLQQTKLLFGRFCYCKGYTGYFKVINGKLDLKFSKEQANIVLDFQITEVPQVLKNIGFTAKN